MNVIEHNATQQFEELYRLRTQLENMQLEQIKYAEFNGDVYFCLGRVL